MTPPQPACRAIVDILTRERPQGPPVRGLPWPCGELPDADILRAVMAQALPGENGKVPRGMKEAVMIPDFCPFCGQPTPKDSTPEKEYPDP